MLPVRILFLFSCELLVVHNLQNVFSYRRIHHVKYLWNIFFSPISYCWEYLLLSSLLMNLYVCWQLWIYCWQESRNWIYFIHQKSDICSPPSNIYLMSILCFLNNWQLIKCHILRTVNSSENEWPLLSCFGFRKCYSWKQ